MIQAKRIRRPNKPVVAKVEAFMGIMYKAITKGEKVSTSKTAKDLRLNSCIGTVMVQKGIIKKRPGGTYAWTWRTEPTTRLAKIVLRDANAYQMRYQQEKGKVELLEMDAPQVQPVPEDKKVTVTQGVLDYTPTAEDAEKEQNAALHFFEQMMATIVEMKGKIDFLYNQLK